MCKNKKKKKVFHWTDGRTHVQLKTIVRNYSSEPHKKLGLTTLEVRRKRCDLIQIYKIKNGIEEVDIDIAGGNQGGYQGRRHDQQITREVMGNVPMRNYSLPIFKSRIDEHIRLDSLRRSVYRV